MFFPASVAQADERITNYIVIAKVEKDGALTVRERITVTAEGDKIKRGIYRDFQVREKTDSGARRVLGFEFLSATRDGVDEPYDVSDEGNNVKIRLGAADIMLPPGKHTYELTYRITGGLRFFDDHDELYWNVTGHDWVFPIDSASFELALPEGGLDDLTGAKAYTGSRGARASDARLEGKNIFRTTRPLAVHEGLTVVFGWKKALVEQPPPTLADSLAAHAWIVYALLILISLAYYLAAWFIWGRDPKPGTVIPLFSAPEGMSPGEVCSLRELKFSPKVFQVDLLWLATDGFLQMSFDGDKTGVLQRTNKDAPSRKMQRKNKEAPSRETGETLQGGLLDEIFPSGSQTTDLDGESDRLQEAYTWLEEQYKKRLKGFWTHNYLASFLGFVIVTLVIALLLTFVPLSDALSSLEDVLDYVFLMLFSEFMVLLGAAGFWVCFRGTQAMKLTLTGRILSMVFCLALLTFGLLCIWMAISDDDWVTATNAYALAAAVLTAYGVAAWFSIVLMPRRSAEGARRLDLINGLALYIGTAEKDRLAVLNAPEDNPQKFEELLPYALALDMAEAWRQRFAALLEGVDYTPSFREDGGDSTLNAWDYISTATIVSAAVAMGAASAVAAASSGSSSFDSSDSGFSDSGSSGGGSGGGGGGGW
ncbi:MAG: DUF2207 domain-containing protein [Desulfovibrio sp.]|nr:DUF2207 domain-containing protein [Desulfovibrio sp.]